MNRVVHDPKWQPILASDLRYLKAQCQTLGYE